MKVFFHPDFYSVYTSDPAAAPGRMEAIMAVIEPHVEICTCEQAPQGDILAVHPRKQVARIRQQGLYQIAALAAGGAIQAAESGMAEPSFALVRPPGHHASADSCWGFCYFNNMAIALQRLRSAGHIQSAFLLDFDFHFGDGNVNIMGDQPWVEILNPDAGDRQTYLDLVERTLKASRADVYAVSAGFDYHLQDWGRLLTTEDYRTLGRWIRQAAHRNRAGCYGILEGGYNHDVLGNNVLAFIEGLQSF